MASLSSLPTHPDFDGCLSVRPVIEEELDVEGFWTLWLVVHGVGEVGHVGDIETLAALRQLVAVTATTQNTPDIYTKGVVD